MRKNGYKTFGINTSILHYNIIQFTVQHLCFQIPFESMYISIKFSVYENNK